MAWYHEGSVTIAADAVAVVGTGTAWLANVQIGAAFVGPDGRTYEITDVGSDHALTIARPYAGGAVADGSYSIQPTGQPIRDLTAEVRRLITSMVDVRDGVGAGLIEDGSPELPTLRFRDDQSSGLARTGEREMAMVVGGKVMVKATERGMALGKVANSEAAVLPAGAAREPEIGYIEDENLYFLRNPVSGLLQRHIIRNYAEDSPGYSRAANADPVANTAAINAVLAVPNTVLYFRSDQTYVLDAALDMGQFCTLAASGGSAKPILFMPAARFTNADLATRYAAKASAIRARGVQTSATTHDPIRRPQIYGLSIRSELGFKRRLNGIVVRGALDMEIDDCMVSDIPLGIGVSLASIGGQSRVHRLAVRNFYDNNTWTGGAPQSTGVETDNDLLGGSVSRNIDFRSIDIRNIEVGETFMAAHGQQTDGMNLAGNSAVTGSGGFRLDGIYCENVGEGIDCFSQDCVMTNLVLQNCYLSGLKFIHGAKNNAVSNFSIVGVGRAGINLAGSGLASRVTSFNTISNGSVSGLNFNRKFDNDNVCGVLIEQATALTKATRNKITGVSIELGEQGHFGWFDAVPGATFNYGEDIDFIGGASAKKRVRIDGAEGLAATANAAQRGGVKRRGMSTWDTDLV